MHVPVSCPRGPVYAAAKTQDMERALDKRNRKIEKIETRPIGLTKMTVTPKTEMTAKMMESSTMRTSKKLTSRLMVMSQTDRKKKMTRMTKMMATIK